MTMVRESGKALDGGAVSPALVRTLVLQGQGAASRTGSVSVSAGICAYNEERRIGRCLESLLGQDLPPGVELREILVVASGCTDRTEAIVQDKARLDSRIILVSERERVGKATAINRLLSRFAGDLLVLLNADAVLEPMSLARLLEAFRADAGMQIACGAPIPEFGQTGVLRLLQEFQWAIHNRALRILSELNRANHCCDEFLAMRRGFVDSLPQDLINDGAYLGVVAAQRGLSIRFCPEAKVAVETPSSLAAMVRQRRRILWGHRQIEELLGRPVNTLKSLAPRSPRLAVRIFMDEMRDHPSRLPTFLLVGFPLEALAGTLVWWDRFRGKAFRPTWTVVD